MRRRKHQSGFSIVEAIIVVIVIGIVGTAGWLIYQHNRTKPTNAASNGQPTQQTTTTTTTTPTAATLDVKEWGVHMTLDSTTASMYYYVKPNLPNVAYLSLKTVSTIAPDCAADKVSLGAISRLTQAEQGAIHIGSYWYSFSTPPAACVANDTQNAAILHALPKYNLQAIINTFNTLAVD